jgi:hypothetical protein
MVGLVGRAVVPAGAGMDVDVAMVARAVVVEEIVEMVAVVARAAVGVMVRSVASLDRSTPEHLARTDSRLVRDSLGLSSDRLC